MKPSEAIENIEYARRWMGCESDFSDEALDMAISALEKQERDKWVPCSKRKPDIDSEVFITDSFGEIGHAYYVNLGDRVCFVTAEEYTILEDVKAWKLVPEAYKGDQS